MNSQFLITAANGDIAEAIALVIRQEFPEAGVHAVDAEGGWPGVAIFDTVQKVPWAGEPGYQDALYAAAQKVGATVVIPTDENEIHRLATEPGAAADLPLLTIRNDLAIAFCDKLGTAEWLSNHGINGPKTVPLTEAKEEELPLIVKPRHGAGSMSVSIVRTASLLRGMQDEHGDKYVAQEYLPDSRSELTCALLRMNGDIRSLSLWRKLSGGRTVSARIVDEPEVDKLLIRIAEATDLQGAINVQLRMTSKGPMIFEINPRFSSTVRMRHLLGFKDLKWAIDALDGSSVPDFKPRTGASVYRLSREMIGPE